jgi:hypothetical protein
MKKIIVLIALGGALFAARYPMIAEYNFLKGCIKSDSKMVNYCVCALTAIENKYSLKEFITAYQEKRIKPIIKYAVTKCVDKLEIPQN